MDRFSLKKLIIIWIVVEKYDYPLILAEKSDHNNQQYDYTPFPPPYVHEKSPLEVFTKPVFDQNQWKSMEETRPQDLKYR